MDQSNQTYIASNPNLKHKLSSLWVVPTLENAYDCNDGDEQSIGQEDERAKEENKLQEYSHLLMGWY